MTTTFMGIPVEADEIYKGFKDRTDQWGADKFWELVKPVLDSGALIRWEQYTPYFNDGDVCEFYVNEPRFSPAGEDDDEGGGYSDGFYDLWEIELMGGEEEKFSHYEKTGQVDMWGYARERAVHKKTGVVFQRHPAYDAMKELASNMGHFEDLLYATFGDHAEVTITPNKIIKESYEHV